ncbi:hypothetical protein D0Z07_0829 [Hyphodiscus hymeniophilus]|uniref:Uncharacterized protein n=1 Tax=Hyphodiscus hymeniophilus TaxID=353542 RepID=A0A9P6VQB3_9HELO|nr:hypothetical protein D0Z07_0829 [Hyphodiscus hymeniophilus]
MHGPDRIIAKNIEFTDEEANVLLMRFRNQMAEFFPFVIISPSLNAQDLKCSRPFLLKAICAVASVIPNHRLSLGKWIVEHLAERMAVDLDRNLDLLLGALTYAGCLCMALIFDLGLNKPIQKATHKTVFEQVLARPIRPGFAYRELPVEVDVERTLEERRAFLGVFFTLSSASKFFRAHVEPPRITPYVYECLEILEKTQDQPTDTSATFMIRLQLIVERISQGPWNTEYGTPEAQSSGPPLRLYIKSLQEQLHNFRSAMRTDVSLQGYMQYYNAEEALCEIGMSRGSVLGDLSDHTFDRMENLYDCLRSTRRFWETFFCIPETRYAHFSTAMWMQISHSFVVLQALSTFDHPDWHLPSIRQEIDFMDVLEKLIERINKTENQIFAKAAIKMTSIKTHIQEQLAVEARNSRHDSLTGQDADFGRPWEPIDFLDNDFFGDIMGMEF